MMGPGINHCDLDIMRDLGIVSQLRGLDGSGVYQINSTQKFNNNSETWYKTYSNFSTLLDEVEGYNYSKTILNSVHPDVIIGHVRSKTRGPITDSNAHPFVFSTLVGAHNGTLKDAKYLGDPDKTDSELLFSDIVTRGMDDVINDLDRDSAYALVMYNKVDKSVYFIRNQLRTLTFAFSQTRAVIYWASEKEMLSFVLKRYGQDFKCYTLSPNILLKVTASSITNSIIGDSPLSIFRTVTKFEKPLPTSVQKAVDAEGERKKKEEEKSKQVVVVKDNIVTTPLFGRGGQEKSNIVSFPPRDKFTIHSKHQKCSCGSAKFNLFEMNRMLRGIDNNTRGIWDPEEKKFFCNKCIPQKEVKENVTV